jgi:hypothetical protein
MRAPGSLSEVGRYLGIIHECEAIKIDAPPDLPPGSTARKSLRSVNVSHELILLRDPCRLSTTDVSGEYRTRHAIVPGPVMLIGSCRSFPCVPPTSAITRNNRNGSKRVLVNLLTGGRLSYQQGP